MLKTKYMKQVSCRNNTKGNVFKLKQDRFFMEEIFYDEDAHCKGDWTKWPWKVPSNPSYPVIIWSFLLVSCTLLANGLVSKLQLFGYFLNKKECQGISCH